MTGRGWVEIFTVLALTLACAWPLGIYIARVWKQETTWLDPLFRPIERICYAIMGIKDTKGQDWKSYAFTLLSFSVLSFAVLYGILRLQHLLPLNPQGFGPMSPDLAFNTAVSFVTNTNWQSYGGEQAASTFSQMAGLTVQNFVSAGEGMAIAAVIARAFIANRSDNLGNFFVDLFRNVFYILIPLSLGVAVLLVLLGVPQSMLAKVDAKTLEGAAQAIPLFPVASQEAIKLLGTNGGGIFNANSAHPFENPSALTNLIEAFSLNVVAVACAFAFGRVVGAKKEAAALISVMTILVTVGAASIYASESLTPPALTAQGVHAGGNLEGKELRLGTSSTSVFAAMTTGASCGAVDAMHASFMPIGATVTLFLMQIGEIAPGGVGSGLYGMVVMALLSVFVAGLMVGRTPEYLGKKVETREIKAAMLAVLVLPMAILGFSAIAAVLPEALKGLLNTDARGLGEIYYGYTSAAANNGSAFAGLTANTPWWNTTLAIGMLLGRFTYAVPVLMIAGSLAAKPKLAPTEGALSAHGPLFVGLLIGVILILGALQFFPTLALTTLLEHVQMAASAAGHA